MRRPVTGASASRTQERVATHPDVQSNVAEAVDRLAKVVVPVPVEKGLLVGRQVERPVVGEPEVGQEWRRSIGDDVPEMSIEVEHSVAVEEPYRGQQLIDDIAGGRLVVADPVDHAVGGLLEHQPQLEWRRTPRLDVRSDALAPVPVRDVLGAVDP